MKIKTKKFVRLIEEYKEQSNDERRLYSRQITAMRDAIRASVDRLNATKKGEEYPPIEDVFTDIEGVIEILMEHCPLF